MNNNQLKQLAWSAYLKGGAHEDDYETFLVWYNQQSQSLPAVEQPEDRNMQDGYYLDCYNNGCQLNCPKCPDKCKVEQPVLSNKIGHINCDSEALKDPEFVNAINRMTELAYHKTAPSQPEGKTLKKLNKEIERKAETFRKSTVNQMRIEKKAYIAGAMEYANQPHKEWIDKMSAKELNEILRVKIHMEEMAKGVGLCPRCGTKNLHYNAILGSYTCAFC